MATRKYTNVLGGRLSVSQMDDSYLFDGFKNLTTVMNADNNLLYNLTRQNVKPVLSVIRAFEQFYYSHTDEYKDSFGYAKMIDGSVISQFYNGKVDDITKNNESIIVLVSASGSVSAIKMFADGTYTAYQPSKTQDTSAAVIYGVLNWMYEKCNAAGNSDSSLFKTNLNNFIHDYEYHNVDIFTENNNNRLLNSCISDFDALLNYRGSCNLVIEGCLDSSDSWEQIVEKWNKDSFPQITTSQLSEIKEDRVESGMLPFLNISGKNNTVNKNVESCHTVSDYGNTFYYSPDRILTMKEKAMIPNLGDYIPDDETLRQAKFIKGTKNTPLPQRNLMWTGITGTGKSTDAQMLAQLLHLPYCFLTISADTAFEDLTVRCMPNENGGFRYVESPLVQAFRNGWVIEVQEPNFAMKPGVIGGLNAALDDNATLEIATTGEIVKRHPDCIIIFTLNPGYEGTRQLNEAVRSRFGLKGVVEMPTDEELTNRIMQRSGYSNRNVVKAMVKARPAFQRILEENGEMNGCISVRELIAWAQVTAILNDPYEAASNTIIPSGSDDPDVQAALRTVLDTDFKPKF